MQMTSELISIAKLDILASLCHDVLYFFSLSVKYRVKNSKYEFTNIIHQNKQGFDGRKRTEGQTGRNSLPFNNTCSRLQRIGYRHTRFKLFFLPRFPVCFPCYAPESFKIICLTCIWLYLYSSKFER